MAENVLIAIGGTGARVVESLVPCLMAGMGPESLTIGFIDQDRSNGNVDRARERLTHYRSFRRTWSEGPNKLPWTGSKPTGLARTDLPTLVDDQLWCPHPNRETSLADIYQRPLLDENEGALMDLLFHADGREQTMKLGEGYRGLPHLGAAALLSEMLADPAPPFWRALREKAGSAKGGAEVRVFLVGSAFGGTGAAGFPTVARALADLRDREKLGRLQLGGLLMLPYFSFTPPEADEIAARPEDLLIQSELALKYYARLFEERPIFNSAYMIGWDPVFNLGYGAPGSDKQRNPPLAPELLGALAALRFFRSTTLEEPNNRVSICSRQEQLRLVWDDLPDVVDSENPREFLGRLLRFCAVWRNTLRGELHDLPFFGRGASFVRAQGGYKVKFAEQAQKDALTAIDQVVDDVLVWAAAMARASTRGGLNDFALWDMTRLSNPNVDAGAPTDIVRLQPPLNEASGQEAYRALVGGTDPKSPPPSQGALIEEMTNTPYPGDEARGLGRFVAAAFRAAGLSDTNAIANPA